VSAILIGGGSRSGKSRFALEYARRHVAPLAFIATAEAGDDEMRDRIASHRAERGPEFETIEEPRDIARVIVEAGDRYGAIVVDCLTLWLSNLMFGGSTDLRRETANLLRVAVESPSAVVLVTNEVGCGIVPENPIGASIPRSCRSHEPAGCCRGSGSLLDGVRHFYAPEMIARLLGAIQFLTTLPVRGSTAPAGQCALFFPLVGAALGTVGAYALLGLREFIPGRWRRSWCSGFGRC
jgi:adenosylcobinamide kinase/adenosylcobinamide-phosphate guanylyltransferase